MYGWLSKFNALVYKLRFKIGISVGIGWRFYDVRIDNIMHGRQDWTNITWYLYAKKYI